MSPLPERSPKTSKLSPSEPVNAEVAASTEHDQTSPAVNAEPESELESVATPPTLHRPVMRPVRPQPPSPPVVQSPAVAPSPVLPKPEVVAKAGESAPTVEVADQDVSRQRPIPPPSEPKQFRAIGLLRGRYVASEEKFTCGEMIAPDGTVIEAVLLGRVMSLVRNHLDLEKDHLWVVYPRTRDKETVGLHVQIVGVWEPETLSQPEDEADLNDAAPDSKAEAAAIDLSPGYEDDYFSIRGEVVAVCQEPEGVVVKIQQTARKSTDRPKAFKLFLDGSLPSNKFPGYFWDFQVKRQGTSLVITESQCIGLLPPRKKQPGEERGKRPTIKRGGYSARGQGERSPRPTPAGVGRPEPPQRPTKRADRVSTGSDDK